MKIYVTLEHECGYPSTQAAMEIPEALIKEFEPLHVCDEPLVAITTGAVSPYSEEVVLVTKFREESAQEIAVTLTNFLVSAMKNQDTSNGYTKKAAA